MTFGEEDARGEEGGMVLPEEVVEWTDDGRAALGGELIRAGEVVDREKSGEQKAGSLDL